MSPQEPPRNPASLHLELIPNEPRKRRNTERKEAKVLAELAKTAPRRVAASRRADRARELLADMYGPKFVDAVELLIAEQIGAALEAAGRARWLTSERAGERFGITADGVVRRIKRGWFAPGEWRKVQGRYYVDADAVDRRIGDTSGSGEDAAF
jgi:hypothetical protein